jgi:hypothetical protein
LLSAIAVGAPEKYAQFEYGLEHTVSELAGALKVVKNKGGASFLYASLEEIMKMQKASSLPLLLKFIVH